MKPIESLKARLSNDKEERVENWAYIKGGFQKWIDRLIVSQGSKYWSWF